MNKYLEKHSNYVFRTKNRPEYISDLNEISEETTTLYIHGDTKNIQKLGSFSKLEELWLSYVNQKEFEDIIKLVNPKLLYIYDLKVDDLSLMERLTNLEILEVEWNTKAANLWDISKNKNLEALYIKDFSKLNDISLIRNSPSLKILSLSGGNSKPLKLQTLEDLGELNQLEYLGLSNVRILDDSLEPISKLNNLKELGISNQFPTEEYAKLSVMLPNTKCEKFNAFAPLGSPIGGKNVMVVGKRKPLLNNREDVIKLKKYEEQFKILQNKYRL